MLYQWGTLQFDMQPFNIHEADHMTDSDWARKEIAGAAVYREWVGEGDEEITLRGRVFPHRLGGLTELEILESFRRAGQAEQLIRGDGFVLGWYVLERLARSHRFLGADGIGQLIQFEGSFARCPVPDANEYFPFLYKLIR
jgi:phage tail protein